MLSSALDLSVHVSIVSFASLGYTTNKVVIPVAQQQPDCDDIDNHQRMAAVSPSKCICHYQSNLRSVNGDSDRNSLYENSVKKSTKIVIQYDSKAAPERSI